MGIYRRGGGGHSRVPKSRGRRRRRADPTPSQPLQQIFASGMSRFTRSGVASTSRGASTARRSVPSSSRWNSSPRRVTVRSANEGDNTNAGSDGAVSEHANRIENMIRETIKDNIPLLDYYVSTNVEVERRSDTSSSMDGMEKANLDAWSSPTFSLFGGAAVIGLLFLFVFVIGPPPTKALGM